MLGFKTVGRGGAFQLAQPALVREYIHERKFFEHWRKLYRWVGIDSLLAHDWEDWLVGANVDPRLYDTREGAFSCYEDAVECKIGPSSFCRPEEFVYVAPRDVPTDLESAWLQVRTTT